MSTMKKKPNSLQISIWSTEDERIYKSVSSISPRRPISCCDPIMKEEHVDNRDNRYYLSRKFAGYCHSCCSLCICGLLLGCFTASIILAVLLTLWITSLETKTTGITNQFTENSYSTRLNTTVTTATTTTATTATTTTTTTTTTTKALPPQCSSYTNNSDSTRKITYNVVQTFCDSNLTAGWYRFVGGAGTALSTTYPGSPTCGATNPGFIPLDTFTNLTLGNSLTMLYCFNRLAINACDYKQNVTVTYCNNFYVFYLNPGPASQCNYRYCTA